MAYNKYELENDPLNAFELGGYNTIKAFKQLQVKKLKPQLGFYGGNAEILQSIDFGNTDDSYLDAIFENKAQCQYAAFLDHRIANQEDEHPFLVSVEVFDFITGMTAILGIPYTSKNNTFESLRIYEPVIFRIQTDGIEEENKTIKEKALEDLLKGVLKNPDYKEVWHGKYEGKFLPLR